MMSIYIDIATPCQLRICGTDFFFSSNCSPGIRTISRPAFSNSYIRKGHRRLAQDLNAIACSFGCVTVMLRARVSSFLKWV